MSDNRFEREPNCWADEDVEFAYVDVTATTDTAAKARGWLITHVEDWYGYSDGLLIHPEHVEARALGLSMERLTLLPGGCDVEWRVRRGLVEAWWRFDVSLAVEELPGPDAEFEERMATLGAERRAQAIRQARGQRGPWWWRARCWLSRRILKVGAALEPATGHPAPAARARWAARLRLRGGERGAELGGPAGAAVGDADRRRAQ